MFLSTLFSATLSTVSSGLNSIAAVIWEDFLKGKYVNKHGDMAKDRNNSDAGSRITMLIVAVMGMAATALAFCCRLLGGIFQVAIGTLGKLAYMFTYYILITSTHTLSFMCYVFAGATGGPCTGLFLLGLFFPAANKRGAFVGLFTALFIAMFIATSSNIYRPYSSYILPMVASYSSWGPMCENVTVQSLSIIAGHYANTSSDLHYGDPNVWPGARLSAFLFGPLGEQLSTRSRGQTQRQCSYVRRLF